MRKITLHKPYKILFSILAFAVVLSVYPGVCLAKIQASFKEVPKLPAPTGEFDIGTSIFHLTDKSRKSPPAGEPDQSREIMVQVWYPAEKTKQGQKTSAYLTHTALLPAMKKNNYLNLTPDVLDTWQHIQTHSTVDAPVNARSEKMPVLFFSPGFGVSRANYTSLLEDLASRGFLVAAIDHPYTGLSVLPDGKTLSSTADERQNAAVERVESMAQDTLFVLSTMLNKKTAIGRRFAKKTDAKRIGIFGHSLGGAAALEICRISKLFKACADLDGSVWGKVETEGVNRPFLIMLNVPGEARRPPEEMRKQRDAEWDKVISAQKTPAYIVKIEGTFHFSFGDFPFLVTDSLLAKNGADIEPQRGFEIISKTLHKFFEHYLSNKSADKLSFDEITKDFPEASIEAFHTIDVAAAAEPFARDIFADGNEIFRGTFSPDGRTFYYFKKVVAGEEEYRIFESNLINGNWTTPKKLTFGGDYSDMYPAISKDGKRLVFSSYRPAPNDKSKKPNAHLWMVEKQKNGDWSEPVFLFEVNDPGHYHSWVEFGWDGNLYFRQTTPDWRSNKTLVARWNGKSFEKPVLFEEAERWKNWREDVRVVGGSPGPKSEMIFLDVAARNPKTGKGASDIWVSIKKDGKWQEPRSLGENVNSEGFDVFPFFSPDGTTMYFVRDFREFYKIALEEAIDIIK